MPITDTNVLDRSEPTPGGEVIGTLEFVFSDGRKVTRNVRAESDLAFDNLIVDLPAQIEKSVAEQDAAEAVDNDQEVTDYKDANEHRIALAYLRRAASQEDAYRAAQGFIRFNDWRIAKGWNLTQVAAALQPHGLTDEEWNGEPDGYPGHKAAFSWVTNASRLTALEAADLIQRLWNQDYRMS